MEIALNIKLKGGFLDEVFPVKILSIEYIFREVASKIINLMEM